MTSILGEVAGATPRVVVLKSPLPYIKVLTGSNVDFTWKFHVTGQSLMMKSISWINFRSDNANWKDDKKLVQKTFTANKSNDEPVKRRSNRVNCTFDIRKQIWTMSCCLTNATPKDSASYGLKIEFDEHETIHAPNTTSLKVVGKLQ